ncbi:PfkB family carbohydrate kinase [bacterium]|nr:PfkB family carbohydrate kinase [bacterium]
MDLNHLQELLTGFRSASVAVFGDFFLDKYLTLEEALTEVSLETGLDAYQVVGRRCSPGAAGTVTNNLTALEVGKVYAVGFTGEDGEGYELRQGLDRTGADSTHLLTCADVATPTYIKPMLRNAAGVERELNRLDIKNREPLAASLQERLLQELGDLLPQVQAVVIADQIAEPELGVVTDTVRAELSALARSHPQVVFFADSRACISRFRDVIIKPNKLEAARSCGYEGEEEALTAADAARFGAQIVARNNRPAFVTAGAEGIVVFEAGRSTHIPGIPVSGPIDIVGAGDSTTAGIVSALCAGATLQEAAVMGNCVASLTIQQLGTTGTAKPQQVAQQFADHAALYAAV